MDLKFSKKLKEKQKDINNVKILCIGDIILDHYVYGRIERISPEAPIPILINEKEVFHLGGAGNVARNISSLGGQVSLLRLCGNDDASKKISKLIKEDNLINDIKFNQKNFETSKKTRFINKSAHILRVDHENINFSLSKVHKKKLLDLLIKKIKSFDLVILSDYNKGFLDSELIKRIIKIANNNRKMILADPKKNDFSIYSGVDMLTPNQKEITDASGKSYLSKEKILFFSKKLINNYNIKNILVTRSEKGMLLISREFNKDFNSIAKEIYDVTGAGDTVIAVLSLMRAIGLDYNQSIIAANYAAGLVIAKKGTATLSFNELISR